MELMRLAEFMNAFEDANREYNKKNVCKYNL